MASPCKVTIKTSKSAAPKEMSFQDYMEMLYNGGLDKFIADGSINTNALKGEAIGEAKAPESREKKIVPKTLLNRAYEGTDNVTVAKAIAKYGLDREVENRIDAKEIAQKFIDKVGPEAALQAVRDNKLEGGAAAFVFAEIIDMVESEMMEAQTEAEMKPLAELQAKLFDELERKQRLGGQFNSAFADIYSNSLFAYSYEKKVKEYKDRNSGYISEEVEKKFKKLDEQIKGLNRKIKDAEARAKLAEENQTIEAIVEAAKRKEEKEAKVTYTQKAKKVADNFRNKLKSKPIEFKDANGNPIRIRTQGISWNDLVEIGARAIETSGKIADGISAMIQRLSEEDWYNNLNDIDRAAVNAQVEAAFSEDTSGKISIPKALIESLVANGINNINDLTAAVMAQMKSKYPSATEREFRDAITGYGKDIAKTSKDIQLEISRIKQLGRLMSKLEDLTAGISRQPNDEKRAKMSEEEKNLKRKINDIMEDLGINQSNRLDRAKENTNKRIEELQRRLDEGDFSKKKKYEAVPDEELIKLRMQKQDLQDQFDTEMYKLDLKNRKTIQKVGDVLLEFWNLPRALMATGEISFLLIQGGIQTLSHPINAARAFKKAMEHFTSERKAKEWGDFVRQQPYYEEMKRAKLSLSQYDAKLNAREETFLGGWVNYIWDYAGWGLKFISPAAYEKWKRANVFKALERATVGYMNTIRILRYLDGAEKLRLEGKNFNDSPQDYKNVADVINTLTGRASLGPLEGMSKPLSLIFFSPRNWSSVIKTTTPFAFYHFGKMGNDGTLKPSVAQKMAMADFMKYVTITASIVGLAAAYFNNDDDEETEVVFDPKSSDFGKIKLGNTRVDPWGGRIQMIVYQSRFILGAVTKDGVTQPLGSGRFTPNRWELTGKLIQNKLAPAAALGVKWMQTRLGKEGKQKLYGKEFLLSEELQGSLYPMYWGTIKELWEDQPETVSGFLTAYAFLGGGVSTYEDKKKGDISVSLGDKETWSPGKYSSWDAQDWVYIKSASGKEEYDMQEDFKDPINSIIDKRTSEILNDKKERIDEETDKTKKTEKLKSYRKDAIEDIRIEFKKEMKTAMADVDLSNVTPEEKAKIIYDKRNAVVEEMKKKYGVESE